MRRTATGAHHEEVAHYRAPYMEHLLYSVPNRCCWRRKRNQHTCHIDVRELTSVVWLLWSGSPSPPAGTVIVWTRINQAMRLGITTALGIRRGHPVACHAQTLASLPKCRMMHVC